MDKKLTDVTDNNVGKMTDNEIVKALECCSSGDTNCCDECPLDKECGVSIPIMEKLMKYALALINCLQAENETLRDVVKQNHLIRNNGKSPLFLIKAEAYEEFIDKFLEKAISTRNYFEIKSLARTVLNELVGDGGCDTCKSLTCDGCELYEELVGEDNAEEKE